MTKQQLLNEINETSFAVTDTVLFLDTHSTCKEALDSFTQLKQRRKLAMAEFEKNYYPLTVDCIENLNSGKWSWGDAPAPWEGCANNVEL